MSNESSDKTPQGTPSYLDYVSAPLEHQESHEAHTQGGDDAPTPTEPYSSDEEFISAPGTPSLLKETINQPNPDYVSPDPVWPCYAPGDLNPQLVGKMGIMNDPSYGDDGNSMGRVGEGIRQAIRPNSLSAADASSAIHGIVLGSYVLEASSARSMNFSSKDITTVEDQRVQVLFVRVPEIHSNIPDPFCGDTNDALCRSKKALIQLHSQIGLPNSLMASHALLPGSIVEIEFTNGYSKGLVKKIVSATSSDLTLGPTQSPSAKDAFNGEGNANPVYNETRPLDPVGIVIHYTVTWTASDAVSVLAKRGLSYHYIVDKDGSVTQLVNPNTRAIHDPKTNKSHIGLAFVNLGNDKANAGKRTAPPLSEWIDAKGSKWEPYPDAQIKAGKGLVSDLVAAYPKITEILEHAESSSKKLDPGPIFPISDFRSLLSVKTTT
mgnify:FL=1